MTALSSAPEPTSPATEVASKRLDPNAAKYDEAKCPIPGCGESLYFTREQTGVIYLADTVEDVGGPGNGTASHWQIGCSDGHVLLLPEGADDTNEFGRDIYEDGHNTDFERLRKLVQK